MNTPINCMLCFNRADNPIVCLQCGTLFCTLCLKNLSHPNPYECIHCSGKKFGPHKNNNDAIQKNTETPQEQRINKPCINFSICRQQVAQAFELEDICSPECMIFVMISDPLQKQNYKEVKSQIEKALHKIKVQSNKVQPKNYTTPQPQSDLGVTQFNFAQVGKNITVNEDKVILAEDQYVFRSVLGDKGFTQGVHYWEISPLAMTENEMKIGVCKSNQVSMDQGFCDYNTGWAYYTVGQLRHGSNSQGAQYGVKIKNKGTIGICLNMNEGSLSFSCDGQFLGIAYQAQELKEGPIYPAVAMLHKAGFSYKTNISLPPYFKKQIMK